MIDMDKYFPYGTNYLLTEPAGQTLFRTIVVNVQTSAGVFTASLVRADENGNYHLDMGVGVLMAEDGIHLSIHNSRTGETKNEIVVPYDRDESKTK